MFVWMESFQQRHTSPLLYVWVECSPQFHARPYLRVCGWNLCRTVPPCHPPPPPPARLWAGGRQCLPGRNSAPCGTSITYLTSGSGNIESMLTYCTNVTVRSDIRLIGYKVVLKLYNKLWWLYNKINLTVSFFAMCMITTIKQRCVFACLSVSCFACMCLCLCVCVRDERYLCEFCARI